MVSGIGRSVPIVLVAFACGITTANAQAPAQAQPPAPVTPIAEINAHRGSVSGAVYTEDGRQIITTGADGAMKLWDAGSHGLVRTIELDDGPATALAISGRRALTGHANGKVVLWDIDKAEKIAQKMRKGKDFDLEDFRDQLRTIKKMGPIEQILGMLPGMGNLKEMAAARNQVDDKQLARVEAIINSMTPRERQNHQIINGQRRKRIAKGSGTSVEEINRLLKQFVQMKKMLKMMGGMSGLGGRKGRDRMKQLRALMNR